MASPTGTVIIYHTVLATDVPLSTTIPDVSMRRGNLEGGAMVDFSQTYTTDDIEPSPPGKTIDTVKIGIDSSLKVPGECRSDRSGHHKKSGTLSHLGLGIPPADKIDQNGGKGALEEADEEAERVQLIRVGDARLGKGPDAPADLHDGKPDGRADLLNDEGARDLHDGVGNCVQMA